ncbi:MAG: RNA 2',3'-cyclic phosphodiesterase [Gemmatimonadaceae bacterium]
MTQVRVRLFLAVELAQPLLDELEAAIAPLRDVAPDIAWVPSEKRHLTLKFLGDVDESHVAEVVAFTEKAAARHRTFSMQVGGLGAFPNFRRARVVWTGVEHEPRLELLHHDVEVAGESRGFEIEGRAFRPHITLARVRSPLPLDAVRRLARAARRIDFTAMQVVDRITLFESTLASSGSRYRRVQDVALQGGR